MNRVYSLVWNRALPTLQVASELTSSTGGDKTECAATSLRRNRLALACMGVLAMGAFALPGVATAAPQTYAVTQSTDDGSGTTSGTLSWAIDQANANPGSTVVIASSLGTITETGRLPALSGATVQGTLHIVNSLRSASSAQQVTIGGVQIGSTAQSAQITGARAEPSSCLDPNYSGGWCVTLQYPSPVAPGVALVADTRSSVQTGSTVTGGPGASGATGGGSGAAGAVGISGSSATLTNDGAITGGSGGRGGIGSSTDAPPNSGGTGGSGATGFNGNAFMLTNGGTIVGGSGGAGGTGARGRSGGNGGTAGTGISGNTFTLTNGGTIVGGTGGAGGPGGIGPNAVSGGNGSTAGTGISGNAFTLTNTGSISGGRGGSGGARNTGHGVGFDGAVGAGGVGILAQGDDSITTSGAISGGLSGSGTQADAVDLSGGGNTLTLEQGYSFNGRVLSASGTGSLATNGGDTLALGGTTNGTFDLAGIGTEFRGFNQLEKTDSGTWIVTGNQGAPFDGGITIQAGTLTNQGDLYNNSGATLNNASTLTNQAILTNGGTLTNNGLLSNVGALNSTGTINGTGSFTQTAGTTTVDGSLSQNSIAINGGTLAGNGGTITSPNTITVASGATLSPGDAPDAVGVLLIEPPFGVFGNLLDMYGNLNVDVDSVTSFDQLYVINGTVTFGSSSVVNFYLNNDTTQAAGQDFTFFNANGFLNFSDVAFNLSGLASGLTYSVADLGGALQLNLLGSTGGGGGTPVSVPEPGALGMFGVGLLLLGAGLTRREQLGIQPRD